MALIDYNEYLEKLGENRGSDFQMANNSVRVSRLCCGWRNFIPAPTLPSASVILNKDSLEAITPIPTIDSGSLQLLGARLSSSGGGGAGIILMDLLVQNGGMDATSIATQTTNLPTAALTRYTNGEGVMGAIIIYAVIGTTATTFTVSYTNQAGVSGRTSTPTQIGAGGFREVMVLLPIPLQASDTGIRSIESVTLAGTTGSVGNFGVCLFKPLAMLSMELTTAVSVLDMVSTGGVIGQFAEINPNACLTIGIISSLNQQISGTIISNEV
jgi:hypothetical protein